MIMIMIMIMKMRMRIEIKKKRKFDEMSGCDDMDLEPTVTTTSNFFDKKFEIGDTLCGDNNINNSPKKKKLKLGNNSNISSISNGSMLSNIQSNGGHIIDEINESPDTFDTNEVSNINHSIELNNEYNYKNINNINGANCHNNNNNNNMNGNCQSILLNGDSINNIHK
eukprot:462133_1